MKTLKKIYVMIALILLFFGVGCKKLIEIDAPIDKSTAEQIFERPKLAIGAMSGIYSEMTAAGQDFANGGISLKCGLLADEFKPGGSFIGFDGNLYKNQLVPDQFNLWTSGYQKFIYRINSIISGVENSKSLNNNIKQVLTGEAKFSRALIYFYLINLYGDVPLVLSTDFKENINTPRMNKDIIYDQIIKDLQDAQGNLKDQYLDINLVPQSSDRVRPNKAAATALLARVYLYQEKLG